MSATRVAVLAVSCLVAQVHGLVAQTDGWTLRMRSSTDSGGGRVKTATMTMKFAGHKMRTEMDDVPTAPGMNLAGSYVLAADNDSTVWTVMPGQQMAMKMDPRRMMGGMSPRFDVVESKVDRTEDLGDGGVILGHATRHNRMMYSTTMKIVLGSDSCYRHMTTTMEMWTAPDVDIGPNMFAAATAMGGLGGMNKFDSLAKLKAITFAKGFALRTVSMVTTGASRDTTRTTLEVTELARGPLDAALFTVPSGLQTMDMATISQQMPPGLLESTMHDAMKTMMKAMCDPTK